MTGGADALDLLGGAARRATRVRGFAPWRPQHDTLRLLHQVLAILDEYLAYLPLTIRQIFYRLVGAHDYPKTEAAYARLGEHLNRARRAELIPMGVIRDDGGVRAGGGGWASATDFIKGLHSQVADFRLDRTQGQPTKLLVLCEAAGMVSQLARVTDPYGVEVISSGGFESVTEQHRLGVEIANEGRPVEILHVGDHDPSGAHLFLALAENIAAFVTKLGGEIGFTRLAVTPEQITRLDLPTAPAKPGDKRAFHGETCQVESIAPDALASILLDVMQSRLDPLAYSRALETEREERDRLVKLIAAGLPSDGGAP
jgi:hypothetical protein